MTERRWHETWTEQCEAAEGIKLRHGIEAAFDYAVGEKLLHFAAAATLYPEFARALPSFVSRVRRMFTVQEIEEHFARIERLRLESELAAVEGDEADLEDPKVAAGRARQFEFVKELLTAPMLGTS